MWRDRSIGFPMLVILIGNDVFKILVQGIMNDIYSICKIVH
jgi:hypothetical protein